MERKWLNFCDIDLILNITPAPWMSYFDQNRFSAPYLLNKIVNSDKTLLYHWERENVWIKFGDLDTIFKVTTL